ncbi:MAG: hypothetical protein QOJ53_152 [Sphingomonadales bacterium]|nr:hypothetical protein [Sphingomonadales bacterium]
MPIARQKGAGKAPGKGEQLARRLQGLGAILAWLLLAVEAPAHAQGDTSFDRYFEAADRFDRLSAEAAQRGGPAPQLSDPQFAALFADLTDARRVFVRTTYPPADLPRLNDVVQRARRIGLVYMYWGSDQPEDSAAGIAAQDRNLTRYQAEVVPMLVFVAEASGVMLRTFRAGLGEPPYAHLTAEQRGSVAEVRRLLPDAMNAMLEIITYPDMAPEWRLALARNMAVIGPGFAAAMTLSQRRGVAQRIRVTRERVRDPETRAALSRALQAFSESGCGGLCAI